MDGTNFVFTSSGANTLVLWEERLLSYDGTQAILYSSQLERTAEYFQNDNVNIPRSEEHTSDSSHFAESRMPSSA